MDVAVDSNAIRAAGIDGGALKSLRSYLQKTRSSLLLSNVVLEELSAQRRIAIEKVERDLITAQKEFKRIFPDIRMETPVLDVAAAVSLYQSRLLSAAEQVHILENDPEDLAELVRRLTQRLPPASSDGEEARDVLIWLAVKRKAQSGRLAFISGDRKAFVTGADLRSELRADLGPYRENILFFRTIDDFLRIHHARSSFIDGGWIGPQVETEIFRDALSAFVGDHREVFSRAITDYGEPTGYVNFLQLAQHKLEDFFVSDVAPDELYVSATFWAELEVEVEYYARIGAERDRYYRSYRLRGGRLRAEYMPEAQVHDDYERWERGAARCDSIYSCVRFEAQLDVAAGTLRAVDINSMEAV